MESFFQVSQILVAILLIGIILLQVRNQGSGFFGSAEASFRTRRGLEKTMFQFTIALAIVFTVLAIIGAMRPSVIF